VFFLMIVCLVVLLVRVGSAVGVLWCLWGVVGVSGGLFCVMFKC